MSAPGTALKEFLSPYFRNHELRDQDDIFASGFVSSLLAVQLVAFVEKRFGVRVENEDLDLDNFRSIAAISTFIERKRAAGAP